MRGWYSDNVEMLIDNTLKMGTSNIFQRPSVHVIWYSSQPATDKKIRACQLDLMELLRQYLMHQQ